MNIHSDIPSIKEFHINKNYRCSQAVITLCNTVIDTIRKRYKHYESKQNVNGCNMNDGLVSMLTFDYAISEFGDCELKWLISQIL